MRTGGDSYWLRQEGIALLEAAQPALGALVHGGQLWRSMAGEKHC